jgi:hypothetical protein
MGSGLFINKHRLIINNLHAMRINYDQRHRIKKITKTRSTKLFR